MIRMYVRSAGEDFAREVDRMGASWDVVIIQLAGIIEKCVIKATKVTSVVLAAFFIFSLGIFTGFFAFSHSLAFILVAIFPIMGSRDIIAAV